MRWKLGKSYDDEDSHGKACDEDKDSTARDVQLSCKHEETHTPMVQPVPLHPRRLGAAGGELAYGRGLSEGLAGGGGVGAVPASVSRRCGFSFHFVLSLPLVSIPRLLPAPHASPSPAPAHTAPPPCAPRSSSSLCASPRRRARGSDSSSDGGSKCDVVEPISWFDTPLFALVTAIRPLRELAARISTRTSTLQAIVCAHTSPPPLSSSQSASETEVAALKEPVARLEAAVKALVERDAAMYAYVEDALAPIERGMRRVERRVAKCEERVSG
ncbi:hypothetical protein C8R45DRAFT_563768 [Mycena sanguinolenta]|nr:hypothetical protein C8R45DRAFT_563768 [Mycena sanguinolenta]